MLNILLVCAGGLSTSFLVQKMKQEAEKRKISVEINAIGGARLAQLVEKVDVVLLAPQAKYLESQVKKDCQAAGVPYANILSTHYGSMDGSAVLSQAMDCIKEKNKGGAKKAKL
jgi:PTS system cellobiose-specific IIB component